MAHIEFTANGVLMIAVGLLARDILGSTALKIWFVTIVVGTWANGTAGLIGAFAGLVKGSAMPSSMRERVV